MRKFFFKVHLYLSLILFPLAVVFGITGGLMAFEPEISNLAHAHLTYVTQAGKPLTVAQVTTKIHDYFPNDTVTEYYLSTSPGISYQVFTQNRKIYINQYTGDTLGTSTGPDGWDKFQNFIHQLHLRLAFRNNGDTGKTIMTWAGVGLFIILPSGIILWWRQKRISIRRNVKSRLVWFDVHSVTGIISFVFLMLLVITGITMGFERSTTPLMYKLTHSSPTPPPDLNIVPPPGATMITTDSAIAIARAALPGAVPFDINVPGPADAYQLRCRYPEDLTPGGRSMVFINPYSCKVLYAEGSRTAPAGTRWKIINRAIHTGDEWGIAGKTVMCLASLALVAQVITGLVMWLKRVYKRRRNAD
ncbi:MAG TPA: PepSY-associated TM helix domain-containing protein [Chitinophagaceae bacterium]|nr:PepSY-associated TM helix domain-containing protein [Chitinophagaceae bacterium]